MHIFLTGISGVGKTTIINRVLKETGRSAGGFRSAGEKVPNGTPSYVYLYPCKRNAATERFTVAYRDGAGYYQADPKVFDEAGVAALTDLQGADLVLMDELGFMENEAYLFQDRVMEVLDGDIPVLGVIKQQDTPFLIRVKTHPGVMVLEVTGSNRDQIEEKVKSIVCFI